jgi:hypothetical protein
MCSRRDLISNQVRRHQLSIKLESLRLSNFNLRNSRMCRHLGDGVTGRNVAVSRPAPSWFPHHGQNPKQQKDEEKS